LSTLQAYEDVTAIPVQLEALPAVGFQLALAAVLSRRVPTPWPALLLRRVEVVPQRYGRSGSPRHVQHHGCIRIVSPCVSLC
jgi:hypothetical protein